MTYKIGNYAQDSPNHRGWFVGTFIEEGAAKSEDVEIKYWEFPAGPTSHDTKTSAIFECSIFLTGKCKGMVDGQNMEFNAGDYVAIQPNTPNNLVMDIIEPISGFTIKAPSDPSAKKVI
jgi:quercetin dioxygenase-like cupin family protein